VNFEDRVHNLTDRSLRAFRPGDTYYVQKIVSDFPITILCEFVELRRGIVVGKVKAVQQRHHAPDFKVGSEIRARRTSCYLWGRIVGDNWARCHWFRSDDWRAVPIGTRAAEEIDA